MVSIAKDHSQYGEATFLESFFGQTLGSFLDIGANDGIMYSNTYNLFLKGWAGVLIEPSPKAFARLAALYQDKNVELYQKAIITQPAESVSLWESTEHMTNGDVGLLSTTIHSEIKKWERTPTAFQEIQVPSCTISELLSLSKYTKFDFISIDTEGLDYEILLQINPVSLGTRALCIEYNGIEPQKYISHMQQLGYRVGLKNGVNLIFVK